ncbi:MAG: hypothetical protein JJE42_12995 [Burkholderiales bacterium]|nr:hypothetical protein [Burkholderiales bacterium]
MILLLGIRARTFPQGLSAGGADVRTAALTLDQFIYYFQRRAGAESFRSKRIAEFALKRLAANGISR